jgi:hypothetical protein
MRQRVAWQTVAYGLLLIRPFLEKVDVERHIALLADYRAEVQEDVVKPTMAVVYETVRVIGELIKSHRMRDHQEFVIRNGNLWFVSGLVLPMVEEYFQRIDTDLPMGRDAILMRMREAAKDKDPLIPEYQKVFWIGKRAARGIALSLDRIEVEMGIPREYWTTMATEEASL